MNNQNMDNGWLGRKRISLLNAGLDNITMNELVENFHKGMLLTLHVDMIAKLQKDRDFYDILPQFDVVTCDSQILVVAAKILGTPMKERVSGSDFFPIWYMHHKNNPSVTVFISGGMPGVAEIAQRNINEKVGRKIIVGTDSPAKDFDNNPEETDRMIAAINDSHATVLMIGLGGGRQEKFLVKHRNRFTYVKTFLPLGGTIDYEAGLIERPPAWVTNVGLEWLYRVLKEPRQRWRRYFVQQPPALYHLLRQKLGVYRNPFEN